MGKAYSVDLRERVAQHVADGGSRREARRRFGVSASTAVRVAASQATRGTARWRRASRGGRRDKASSHPISGSWSMPELAGALEAEHG